MTEKAKSDLFAQPVRKLSADEIEKIAGGSAMLRKIGSGQDNSGYTGFHNSTG